MIGSGTHQIGNLGFVRISNDPFYAGQGGQFLGRALRVAARNQDAGARISR
jgi:hypothetical protein